MGGIGYIISRSAEKGIENFKGKNREKDQPAEGKNKIYTVGNEFIVHDKLRYKKASCQNPVSGCVQGNNQTKTKRLFPIPDAAQRNKRQYMPA